MSELTFHPFDAAQTQNMWALMREFRERAPVAPIDDGFVYVSRYADARTVLRNSEIYSNAGGMRPTGLVVPIEDRSIGETIPPVHGPIRKLAMAAAAGPGVVENLRPFTRESSDGYLGSVVARGSGDLIAEFSLALTNCVIAKLLGISIEDGEQLTAWGEEIMVSTLTTLNRTERGEGYAGAFPEFTQYLEKLIEDRRRGAVAGDTIHRIVQTGLDDAELTVPIIRMILLNLLLGGTATTRDFIGNLLLELLRRPELHAALRADRNLVPAAVEESLRVAPPVLYLIRTCTERTELAGVTLEAEQRVVVGIASANRDETVYDDPDTFRLDRVDPASHLSLGFGRHFCVGAALARMEGQEALHAFLDRFEPGQIRFAKDFALEMMPLPYMLGPLRLDVEV